MKPIVFLIIICTLSAYSQAPQNPSPAGPQSGQLPSSPVNPGLPASPVNPGLPGFNNSLGTNQNQFGSNVLSGDLAAVLAVLENDIQQALPIITAFNNSFDFTSAGSTSSLTTSNGLNTGNAGLGNTLPNGASANTTTTTPIGNLSTLLSGNASASLGQNLGQNTATPTSPGTPAQGAASGTANQAANQFGSAPFSSTGVNNSSGLVSGSGGLFGTGTNGLPSFGGGENALRGTIILQSDMERMLPILMALNGGLNGLSAGSNAFGLRSTNSLSGLNNGALNNGSVRTPNRTIPTPVGTTGARTLTPTGR